MDLFYIQLLKSLLNTRKRIAPIIYQGKVYDLNIRKALKALIDCNGRCTIMYIIQESKKKNEHKPHPF